MPFQVDLRRSDADLAAEISRAYGLTMTDALAAVKALRAPKLDLQPPAPESEPEQGPGLDKSGRRRK